MKKTKAFTLAEVLIVMGIIGVLAILTVPNMLSNVDARKRSTSFKKAYTTLSNIYSSYFTGAVQAPRQSTTRDINNLYLALLDKLSIDYYYQDDEDVTTKDKEYSTTTTAQSTEAELGQNTDYSTTWIKTTDGMAYLIGAPTETRPCADRLTLNNDDHSTITAGEDATCMWVTVDYNAEKTPNVHCATNGGVTEAAGTKIQDQQITNLANCDRITFLLSRTGFTAGNPDTTVAGKFIGSD